MGSHLRILQAINDGEPLGRDKLYSSFGIHADNSTADDDGIDSLLNAAEDYGYLAVEGGGSWLLTRPLELSQRDGLTITTERFPNTDVQGGSTPWIRWNGDKGAPMIVMDRCLNVELDGFVVETDDQQRKRNPAGIGILVDGGQDTGPGSHIGGSCTFRRLRHVTYPGTLDIAATFIAIALTTKCNQEFHRIVECGGNGNGRGTFLHLGPSYNTKADVLEYSKYIDRYDRAVVVDNGFLDLLRNNMNNNEWDLWLGAGGSSVGFVSECYHIGEASRHHAFVNMPLTAFGQGTYDQSWARPRSELLRNPRGYPVGTPEAARPVENCWILFGPDCPTATIRDVTLGTMRKGADENTKVFGFMDAGANGRVDLGPIYLGRNHTLRTLGLDEDTLLQVRGEWEIRLHAPNVGAIASGVNPNGPGVLDLPSGEFHFNARGVHYSQIPGLEFTEPSKLRVADGPMPWPQIARGQTVLYRIGRAPQLRFQHVDVDGRRKMGTVGQETDATS